MGKLNELLTTTEVVKNILENDPKARNSDNYLLSATYAAIGKEHGIDIENMPVLIFFTKLKEYNLPAPETIRRTRQKLQAENPELASCANVEAARMLNEDAFKEYAKEIKL